jgi:hypothetical protein
MSKRQGAVTSEMEKSLKLWTEDQYKEKHSNEYFNHSSYWKKCSGASAAKALEIYATKVWFNRFKNRVQLHNIRLTGESASANTQASLEFLKKFARTVEEGAIPLIKLLMLMRQD